MYGNASVAIPAVVGGAAVLPFTGVSLVWIALAAFALIAAGLAVLRVVPRSQA